MAMAIGVSQAQATGAAQFIGVRPPSSRLARVDVEEFRALVWAQAHRRCTSQVFLAALAGAGGAACASRGLRPLRRPSRDAGRPVATTRATAQAEVEPRLDAARGYDRKAWQTGYQSAQEETCCSLYSEALPADLRGTYFRNGPAKFQVGGDQIMHPFDGDGMVAAVTFDGSGHAHFRNRHVRTPGFVEELEAKRMLYRGQFSLKPGGWLSNAFDMRVKNVANTNVMHWAGRLFALWEGGKPTELDPLSLATKGETNFDSALKEGDTFTAHPRRDCKSGREVGFMYKPDPSADLTRVSFWEFEPEGGGFDGRRLDVELPGFGFYHDFLVTDSFYILSRAPVAISPQRGLEGLLGLRRPFPGATGDPEMDQQTPGGGHPGGRVVVVWAVSGETVASVETEGQRSVKALKTQLAHLVGLSRFRLRLCTCTTGQILDDATLLGELGEEDRQNLQLVILKTVELEEEEHQRLLAACAENRCEEVEEVLQRPVSPNSPGSNGRALVHVAALDGHVEVVRLLLEARADVNRIVEQSQETALHLAAWKNHQELVQVLLEAGALIDPVIHSVEETPLHLAARKGHVEVVRLLLEAGADKEKVTYHSEETALHLAARKGHEEVVQQLLEASVDPEKAIKDTEETALHVAARKSHAGVVRLLLEAKADKDRQCIKDTAVHLAARNGHLEVMRLSIGEAIDFDESKVAQLVLVPRDGSDIRYVDLDTHFCTHFGNGYELEDKLVVDFVRAPTLSLIGNSSAQQRPVWEVVELDTLEPNRFTRYEIDLPSQRWEKHELSDQHLDYPSINPAFSSNPAYRYTWCGISAMNGRTGPLQGLAKVDVTGAEATEMWLPPEEEFLGEVVFSPPRRRHC
ncbi:unnamed protein product [Durusdinium trenchii]|uniref:Ubiquitin-like domain-containing protein n=1 Tax=Durusdinium trenchii TaxID=1381693 RepID=A0ABP0PIA1_9DINO